MSGDLTTASTRLQEKHFDSVKLGFDSYVIACLNLGGVVTHASKGAMVHPRIPAHSLSCSVYRGR
eukprot:16985-Eustigmatos_ZCMA.PRE.1